MTKKLPPVNCPACRMPMSHRCSHESVLTAMNFQGCLRRCETCGIAASNAMNSPTHIHRDPVTNIPIEARDGAREVISRALNVRNRASKWLKFGYSTSEDAVTWTVFSYLVRSGELVRLLTKSGVIQQNARAVSPELLLWGVPLGRSAIGAKVEHRLKAACESLGEGQNSFSEPDVIIDLGEHGLVFIEVKHRSGNDFKNHTYSGWTRYESCLSSIAQFDCIRDSGFYELARNWCLLKTLVVSNSPATLINLGPAKLFAGREGVRLAQFASGLRTDHLSLFRTSVWSDFLMPILADAPGWLVRFCRERGLLADHLSCAEDRAF